MQPSSLEIVQTLRGVNIVQRFHRLYLDNHTFLDYEVRDKITNQDIPVTNLDSVLLGDLQTHLLKFDCQRVFINLFKEPRAQDIAHLMDTADDFLCDLI